MRHFKRCWVRSWKMRRTNTIESVSTMDILTGEKIEVSRIFLENIQKLLAPGRTRTRRYIFHHTSDSSSTLCDSIHDTLLYYRYFSLFYLLNIFIPVSFWEQWDYFTSFYFFFVSLSTIGSVFRFL